METHYLDYILINHTGRYDPLSGNSVGEGPRAISHPPASQGVKKSPVAVTRNSYCRFCWPMDCGCFL